MNNREPATFQAYYNQPYNAIVQPQRFLFYFRRRWMRELGPVGTSIVIYLRGLCYYNPDKNELRDTCECRLEDIAEGIGVSRATVARELGEHAKGDPNKGVEKGGLVNPALARFVTRQQQFNLTDRGVRRTVTLYHVSMDEPLHPDDQAHYELLCRQSSAHETTPRDVRKPIYKRPGHTEPPGVSSPSGPDEPKSQIETMAPDVPPKSQIETGRRLPKSQFETAYKSVYSLFTNVDNVERSGDDINIHEQGDMGELRHPTDMVSDLIETYVGRVAKLLDDAKSMRRHRQLVGICESRNLLSLIDQALGATAKKEGDIAHGKRGAYYQAVLVKLLENHGVHIPKVSERGETARVADLVRGSLDSAADPPPPPEAGGAGAASVANTEASEIAELAVSGGAELARWQRFREEKLRKYEHELRDMSPAIRARVVKNFSSPERLRSLWREWKAAPENNS